MDEVEIAAMSAVTVSRQYGSGGGEIAARLAARLGWTLVDHDIVVQVARRLGMSEAEALAWDERAPGFVSRLVDALLLIAPPEVPVIPSEAPVDPNQRFHETVVQIIEAAAQRRHVVIVGRGAQVVLAERPDVLHVRVVAPLPRRIQYVAVREGLDPVAARQRIQVKDRDRAHYLQTYHHRQLDDPLLYDLIINTGVLDLDSACDLITLALERKARLRSVPAAELGPAAGLDRYRGTPGDLRPPSLASD